ncbi:MAG: hypothetical protein V4722_17485 [Bacteroidota bacterium]
MKYTRFLTVGFAILIAGFHSRAQAPQIFSTEAIKAIVNSGSGLYGPGKPVVGRGTGGWLLRTKNVEMPNV